MKNFLRLPAFASLCFALVASPLVSGCSGEPRDEAETAEAAVSAPTPAGGTFLVLDPSDKIVATLGAADRTIEAVASKPFGIGGFGAYIFQKESGESVSVVTAYASGTGAARLELVTNLETGETAMAVADDLRASLDESSVEGFLDALRLDLEGVQRAAEASAAEASAASEAGVKPAAWWWPWSREEGVPADGTWCGTRAIASVLSGVLGSAAFVKGAGYALVSGLLLTYPGAPVAVTAAFFGGLAGVVGGVILVGIGVVTLAYTTYVCATE